MFDRYAETDGPIKVTISGSNTPIALHVADGDHYRVVPGRGVTRSSQQFDDGRLRVDIPYQNKSGAGATKIAVPPGSIVRVETWNTYFSFDGRELLNGQRIPDEQPTPPISLRLRPERGRGSVRDLVGPLNVESLHADLHAHVDGHAQISTGQGLMEISGSGKRFCEVRGIDGEILLRPGDLEVHVDYLYRLDTPEPSRQGRVRLAALNADGMLLPVGKYTVTPSGEVLELKPFAPTQLATAALQTPGQAYSPARVSRGDSAAPVVDSSAKPAVQISTSSSDQPGKRL